MVWIQRTITWSVVFRISSLRTHFCSSQSQLQSELLCCSPAISKNWFCFYKSITNIFFYQLWLLALLLHVTFWKLWSSLVSCAILHAQPRLLSLDFNFLGLMHKFQRKFFVVFQSKANFSRPYYLTIVLLKKIFIVLSFPALNYYIRYSRLVLRLFFWCQMQSWCSWKQVH